MTEKKPITIEIPASAAQRVIEALDVSVQHDTDERRRAVARALQEQIAKKLHDM